MKQKTTGRPPGRPRLGEQRRVPTQISMDPSILEQLENRAEQLGLTRSQLIHTLLEGALEDAE